MKIKIRQFLSLVSFALLLTIISCGKHKDDANTSGQFTATFGSVTYQASVVNAYAINSVYFIEGIQVKSGDSTFLHLSIPEATEVNAQVSFDHAELDYFNKKATLGYSSWHQPSHGSITLVSYDKTNKKITGKFSGVLYSGINNSDSVVVSNGQFNVTFQK